MASPSGSTIALQTTNRSIGRFCADADYFTEYDVIQEIAVSNSEIGRGEVNAHPVNFSGEDNPGHKEVAR